MLISPVAADDPYSVLVAPFIISIDSMLARFKKFRLKSSSILDGSDTLIPSTMTKTCLLLPPLNEYVRF